MINEIPTKRLLLRRMRVSDTHSLFRIWSDPEVTKYMNISNFTKESQAKEMIELLDELTRANKAVRFCIIDQASHEIIGSCGFNLIDLDNAKAEIGYDLAKAYWGLGYAPEAIHALTQHAFKKLRLNRIEAKVEPANVSSIKVLNKCNFTYEGTLRQYEKSKEIFIDISMYSLLSTD